MNSTLSTALKGLIVGGSMTVPGVSGGTMAILLNIYDELIASVNKLTKRDFSPLPFLLLFAASGGVGIVLIAQPLKHFIHLYPIPTLFFFMGAVVGGIPVMYRRAGVTSFSWKVIVYPLIGAALVLAMELLSDSSFMPSQKGGTENIFLLFIVGILIAAALVLPGISGSFMLLVLGLYEKTTVAAAAPFQHLSFIIPLGLGALVGIFLTTGILEKLMKNYPQGTYLLILGFVLGSLSVIWPGFPTGIEIPVSVGLFLLSSVGLFALSRLEEA